MAKVPPRETGVSSYGKDVHVTTTVEPQVPHTAAEQFALRQQSPLQRIQHTAFTSLDQPITGVDRFIIAFTIINPRFVQPQTIGIILQQVSVIAALAIGQTLVILTAGIDLSVGAIAILSSLLMANLAAHNGVPGVLALLIGIAAGTACRGYQRHTGHPAQPATVHCDAGYAEHLHRDRAALLWWPAGRAAGDAAHPPLGRDPNRDRAFPHHHGCDHRAIMAVIMAFILGQTSWGRHVYAVGDDAEAARLVGIRVDRVLLSVYTVAGLIYGITGWVQIGRSVPQPQRHRGRQPGEHHRRRDRRHQPVRRARHHYRHDPGCADRGSVQDRSELGRESTTSGAFRHWLARHRRGLDRPVD